MSQKRGQKGGRRRANAEVIQGQSFFNVVLGWRRKARLDGIRVERNRTLELFGGTENFCDQHLGVPIDILYG